MNFRPSHYDEVEDCLRKLKTSFGRDPHVSEVDLALGVPSHTLKETLTQMALKGILDIKAGVVRFKRTPAEDAAEELFD